MRGYRPGPLTAARSPTPRSTSRRRVGHECGRLWKAARDARPGRRRLGRVVPGRQADPLRSTAFSGADTLVVVNTDGSGLRYVFTRSRSFGHTGYSPAWAPDGGSLRQGERGLGRSARSVPTAAGSPSSLLPGSRQLLALADGKCSRSGIATQTAWCDGRQRLGAGGRPRRGGVAVRVLRPGHRTAASSCWRNALRACCPVSPLPNHAKLSAEHELHPSQ